jgi:hypothetical protein
MRLKQRVLHGILGRREVVPATDKDAEHLRCQDAVLVHSAVAGVLLIIGRTSIHS